MQASTCRRRPLGGASLDTHVHFTAEAPTPASLTSVAQKQAETQKQRVQYQLEQLCQFLEQQEQLFVTWLDEVGQTINHVRKTYGTQMTRDVAVLDELIGELEAKQCQPEWELMKDIRVTLHRAKMVTDPELWTAPPEVKEKIHLLYQRSEFVERSMKHFLETLRSGMDTFNVPELIGGQAP